MDRSCTMILQQIRFRTGLHVLFVSLLSLVDGVLTETMAKKYLYDIVSGLQYCCLD